MISPMASIGDGNKKSVLLFVINFNCRLNQYVASITIRYGLYNYDINSITSLQLYDPNYDYGHWEVVDWTN